VTLTDNANGTATIAGTPAAGSAGTDAITLSATNSVGMATQAFSLAVQSPAISLVTSAVPTSFSAPATAIAFSYLVTNTGNVSLSAIGVSDPLSGLSPVTCPATTLAAGAAETCTATYTTAQSEVDAGGISDEATASGTAPSATVVSTSYSMSVPATQTPAMSLAVSANPTSFATAGTPIIFSYVVTNTGNITLGGVGVSDPLAGLSPVTCPATTLAPGAAETCTATYVTTAADVATGSITDPTMATGTTPSATVVTASASLIVPWLVAPVITSAASTTVPENNAMSFTFSATGTPAPVLTLTGTLPKGLTFTGGTGSATLSGTPTSTGTYALTLTATSSRGTVTQAFSLKVTGLATAPTITSAKTATATVGTAFSFTVKTNGSPTSSISESGPLPTGLALLDLGNGTATLSGTPAAKTGGVYPITLSAKNTQGSATQAFTLTVRQAPVITSVASATAATGTAFSFTVIASGYPAPTLSHSGKLPNGVTFKNNGGTATISGTPTTGGVFTLTLTASNAAGKSTQTFVLTVSQAPAFSSAATRTVTVGRAFTFSVKATGAPAPAIVQTTPGSLPAGVTLVDLGTGTATLSGTPATAGTYQVTITATNASGTATQTFTLTVRA
jgi:uncharacterized repeat protein (TIGR01451 family)